MENDEGTVVEIAPKKTRRSPARKPASGARTRRAPSRRPAARKKTASREQSFEGIIRGIAASVSVARAAIAEASGHGAATVKKALGSASNSSRRTITRLAREWKGMDPKKKARVLAALLGAAAAASAPLMARRFKK
ncbi:MAG TPA: hypothetical protein VGH97_04475 [Thermoanaerobaculia bacterium]